MPVEVVQHRNFARAKQSFLLYHRLYPLRAVSIFVLLVLPCFEVIDVLYLFYDAYDVFILCGEVGACKTFAKLALLVN